MNKTVSELIELIPDLNIRKRVLELVEPQDMGSNIYKSTGEMIDYLLEWGDLEEGFKYWQRISEGYINYK